MLPNLPDEIDASYQQRSILDVLIRAHPRRVCGDSIIDAIYANDPNGGAECARTVLHVQMNRLRKRMAGTGWTIPRCRGGKGNVGFYGLVREAAR